MGPEGRFGTLCFILAAFIFIFGGFCDNVPGWLSSMSWSSSLGSLGSTCIPPTGLALLGIYSDIKNLPEEVKSIPITTDSENTKVLFRQGVMQMWNFNTNESVRNFEAGIAEGNCAMCYWGLAMAKGTNINRFVEAADVETAMKALEEARKYDNLSEMEKILIDSQTSRWPQVPDIEAGIKEWKENGQDYYDKRYVASMAGTMAGPHHGDTLLQLMYVESVMNFNRWNYYDTIIHPLHGDNNDNNNNYGNDTAIVSALDGSYGAPVKVVRSSLENMYDMLHSVLRRSPTHPLALHLWIHVTEQSNTPRLGLEAADSLAAASLHWGMGHLSHMPAHTYLRSGEYTKVVHSSLVAIEDDRDYAKKCLIPYCPQHNIAVMMHAALHSGLRELALQWAPSHPATDSDVLLAQFITGLYLIPLEFVLCKFGAWAELKMLPAGQSVTRAYKKASLERELLLLRGAENSNDGSHAAVTHTLRGGGARKLTDEENDTPAFLKTISAYSQALLAIHNPGRSSGGVVKQRLDELQTVAEAIVPDKEAFKLDLTHVFYPNHKEMGKIMVLMARAAQAIAAAKNDGKVKGKGKGKDKGKDKDKGKEENGAAMAVTLLDEAVVLQDSFRYMEPEHYYTPVRHCLGAALLAQHTATTEEEEGKGKAGQQVLHLLLAAERVYRRDLEDHPHNIWALTGLHETLSRQQELPLIPGQNSRRRREMFEAVEEELKHAQSKADFVPRGSCCELGLC